MPTCICLIENYDIHVHDCVRHVSNMTNIIIKTNKGNVYFVI